MVGDVRFRIEPRDVPREAVARRLGLTLARFDASLPNLTARGFPVPDPDTGNFDLQAIDAWSIIARHARIRLRIMASMKKVTDISWIVVKKRTASFQFVSK
jgi:hypothetical protein